jgi:ubiquinone/menaquinone biosynthesis C-methylase UbiE
MAESINPDNSLQQRLAKGGYGADQGIPGDYRAMIESDPIWQAEIKRFLALIPERLNLESGSIGLDQATVLDVGSGPGTMAERIKAKRVIAMDREYNMLKDIKARLSPPKSNVEVVEGDFLDIPLADDSVEVVMSAGTVRHIPLDRKDQTGQSMSPKDIEDRFLSEQLRVLKPGGVLILDNIWNGNDPTVERYFSARREDEIIQTRVSQIHESWRQKSDTDPNSFLVDRVYVFSTQDLKERLYSLGYDCQIDLDCEEGKKYGNVRITLLKKLPKKS